MGTTAIPVIRVNTALPAELAERMALAAAERGISQAEAMRQSIALWLAVEAGGKGA